MTKIYQHHNGAEIHQTGAAEIPLKLFSQNFGLVILSAKQYQPKGPKAPRHLRNVDRYYIPLRDTVSLTKQELKNVEERAKRAAKLAADRIRKGENVLITCMAGLNRSGLITGLTLKQLTNLSSDEIVKLIRDRRSYWALSNSLFERVVRRS